MMLTPLEIWLPCFRLAYIHSVSGTVNVLPWLMVKKLHCVRKTRLSYLWASQRAAVVSRTMLISRCLLFSTPCRRAQVSSSEEGFESGAFRHLHSHCSNCVLWGAGGEFWVLLSCQYILWEKWQVVRRGLAQQANQVLWQTVLYFCLLRHKNCMSWCVAWQWGLWLWRGERGTHFWCLLNRF